MGLCTRLFLLCHITTSGVSSLMVKQPALKVEEPPLWQPAEKNETFWFPSAFPVPEYYRKDPFTGGPTQIDDLGMVFAMVKELRPATLVEIGFLKGDGTKILLSACDPKSRVFSFDPRADAGALVADNRTGGRLVFSKKQGENVTKADLEGRSIDFLFLDASHQYQSNIDIWKNVVPLLSEDAVVAIHDTGYWSKYFVDQEKVPPGSYWRRGKVHGSGDREFYLHENHVEERRFVNWVNKNYPEFSSINMHTFRYLRNGLTILQKHRELET